MDVGQELVLYWLVKGESKKVVEEGVSYVIRIHTLETPLAVYHVPRELEYGLTFYRNHLTFNYDWGRVPAEEHLLVAPESSQVEVANLVAGRRVSYLGHYAARHVDYYWIAARTETAH